MYTKIVTICVILIAGFVLWAWNTSALADDALISQTGFSTFCNEWFATLKSKGCYSPDRLCIRSSDETLQQMIAEYANIEEIISQEVKKTSSEQTPYVGIVKYLVVYYCSPGKTSSEAKHGNFRQCNSQIVTEIFCYRNGKWVY